MFGDIILTLARTESATFKPRSRLYVFPGRAAPRLGVHRMRGVSVFVPKVHSWNRQISAATTQPHPPPAIAFYVLLEVLVILFLYMARRLRF